MSDSPITIVIGAAGGIGRATVARLRDRGHHIVACGRSSESLKLLANEHDLATHQLDAQDFDATEQTFKEVIESQGRIDHVINLAGSIMLKPAHLTTKEDLDQVLQQNLYTAFSVVRAAAKTMKKQGNVILMSTVAARVGLANHEAIAAAKAGVIGLAQAAAASYARRHLRFNVIAPGLVDTPLAKPITSNDKAREASEKMHPLGTLGTPANIAAAIDWLVSPDNHWMTGQVIGIDGGLSTVRPIS